MAMAGEGKTRFDRASRFKQQVYLALEDLSGAHGLARVVGVGLFVLIVLNALLVFVDSNPGVPYALSQVFLAFGLASSVCFGVEYLARLWVADLAHAGLSPLRARARYALSPMGVIDLLAFLPGLLVFLVPVSPSALNAARIVRLIRLIKLSRYMRGLRSIARVFHKRRSEIIASFMVLGLLTVTASVLMYQVENPVQPDKFDSVLTGMYWAMTTITSTGYGDLVPVTALGRFVGFVTMVLSIGVVAIPAGIFSAGFVSEFRAQDARNHDAGERLENPDNRDGCED
ncbi:ion transporter [Paraeggerthella sp.]|uniref:ion transporter n=1 Tax=Paraeggerthella sp. TaxID=2897350 RepID=UPI003AB41CD0